MADQPGIGIDGLSRTTGNAMVRYTDWKTLFREFAMQTEVPGINTWLRDVKHWPQSKIDSGQTQHRIIGWSRRRAELQQKITQKAIDRAVEEEMRRVPMLRQAKLNLVARIISDVGDWKNLNSSDKQLCYQILKVELGEATTVKPKSSEDQRDPVELLLEQDGLMKDGELIIDDDPSEDSKLVGGGDSPEATEADSQTPTPIS